MPLAPVEPDMIPVDKWVGGCKAIYILICRSGYIARVLLPKSRFPFAFLNVKFVYLVQYHLAMALNEKKLFT